MSRLTRALITGAIFGGCSVVVLVILKQYGIINTDSVIRGMLVGSSFTLIGMCVGGQIWKE